MRYQILRSVQDKSLHLIFVEESFAALPDQIRHLGPWQGITRGEVDHLKGHYRLQLAEQGFVVVHQKIGAFIAEQPRAGKSH